MKLRDRDAILTIDGIIFRVYGHIHPFGAFLCDPEYTSSKIYKSSNPRATRGAIKPIYYKFFADEGLKFVSNTFPKHNIFYEPLQKCLVGVKNEDIKEIRKPDTVFQKLLLKEPEDALLKTLNHLFNLVSFRSGLTHKNFGIFGSLLHRLPLQSSHQFCKLDGKT